jgi:ABC-type thiamin/hydroxymethylpyrimidine transport system permease subunit
MKSSVERVCWVLRLTALVALVQGLGHAFIFVTARPRHGPGEVAVIEAMRARAFNFGGFAPHSYWDLYYGYGLLAVVFALFIAAILWLTSGLAGHPRQLRRFVGCLAAGVAVHAAIITRYFFLLPLEFDLAVLAGLGLSLVLARNMPAVLTERPS